jgi:hypothetical protein
VGLHASIVAHSSGDFSSARLLAAVFGDGDELDVASAAEGSASTSAARHVQSEIFAVML